MSASKGHGYDVGKEIAAVGRPFQVGMLYDGRHDTLLTETFWDLGKIKDATHHSVFTSNEFSFHESDSFSSKCSALNIDANLKLSLLGGLIKGGGSAKFLHDKKSLEKIARVTFQYKSTLCMEQIGMSLLHNLEYKHLLKHTNATHVVSWVIYGYNAFFVFEREIKSSENKQDVKGKLKASIKKLSSIAGAHGKVSVDADKDSEDSEKNITCKYHGDFPLEENPIDLEGAARAFQSLSKLTSPHEKGSEAGVPHLVTLYPIASIVAATAVLKEAKPYGEIKEIGGPVVMLVQNVVELLQNATVRVESLLQSDACTAVAALDKEIKLFLSYIEIFQAKFEAILKDKVPKIRDGTCDASTLTKVLSDIEKLPLCEDMVTQYLEAKKVEVAFVHTCLDALRTQVDALHFVNDVRIFLAEMLKDSVSNLPQVVYLCNLQPDKPSKYLESVKKYVNSEPLAVPKEVL